MAKENPLRPPNSGSFKPGQCTPGQGRPKMTEPQRLAREMRGACQPEVVDRLLEIARTADDIKDRLTALKALLEELPREVKVEDVTERPLAGVSAEDLLALLNRR